jgi:hypothetical protein
VSILKSTYGLLDQIGPNNTKNSVKTDATVAGINPFHAGGIDPIKTTDKSVSKNTNPKVTQTYRGISPKITSNIIKRHIALLINVAHMRGSASRGCVVDTL